ncbi:hypothetical protein G6F59_015491 [Rhizopus arrhizus]|nr:hypothetical protein G6F59_015491 [Rhizopus arrhizus]
MVPPPGSRCGEITACRLATATAPVGTAVGVAGRKAQHEHHAAGVAVQGDDVVWRHAGRARLVIFAAGRLREQMREQWCQRCHVRRRQRMPANALQAGDQLAFVLAVAAQVEQSVFQHQRRILGDGIGLLRRRHRG